MRTGITNTKVKMQSAITAAMAMLLDPFAVMSKFDKDLINYEILPTGRTLPVRFFPSYVTVPTKEHQKVRMAMAAAKRERRMERNLRNREAMLKGSYKEAA